MMKGRTLKASVTVFVLIMLGFVIGMYIVGFTSPAVNLVQNTVLGTDGGINENFNASAFIDAIGKAILSPLGLTTLGIIALMSLIGYFVGGSAGAVQATALSYFIPVIILFAVANIFFFPVIPEASAQGLPRDLSFILTIFFNVFLLLAIVSFVTGRD
jgi:hypothetical protein